MAKQNKYQQIINVTSEILKQNPKGLKYGELFDMIIEKLPDIEKNTIHGTFYVYSDEFPPEIQKLKRGFYKWIDEPTDTTIEIDYKDKEDEFSVINGKITSIRLRNYNQFTDVFIDLTYPKGHKKAGLPLDKICIIGQSGTGKTSLLNLIRYFSSTKETKEQQKIIEIDSEAEITIQYFMNDIKIALHYTAKKISYEIQQNSKNLSTDDIWLQLIEWQSKQKHKLIYFPADQIKHLDSLLQPSSDSITGKLVQDKVLDFSILQPEYIWTQITDDIKEYNKELANKSLELGKEAELGKGEQAIRNFLNWKNTNPNPLEKLANNCLNIFFNNFGIKVKTQIDDINEINFIELQTKDGKDLDTKYWSTGTKQIIMRAVPLYQLKPHKAIILFDEAENSLYPDIQMNLIDFYTKLAIDSQFFFSTHSPLIASSFEPYEIVELKFDETYSSVYCEKYYKTTERHIDNYSIQPQYLSWDAILTNIFRLQVDGNPKRKEKLNELTEIGLRLRQLKAEGASNEKMLELWNEYQKLAELLNWKIA